MKNNRGFSLIELIIVIAIMATMVGLGTGIIGMVSGSRVKECAEKMQTAISKSRVEAMSKSTHAGGSDYYIDVYKGADGQFYVKIHSKSVSIEEVVGAKQLTVSYVDSSNATQVLDGTPAGILTLKFKRDTGGFRTLSSGNTCKKIVITDGRITKEIVLSPITGKITLE